MPNSKVIRFKQPTKQITIYKDEALLPENIKKGIEIEGIVGTLESPTIADKYQLDMNNVTYDTAGLGTLTMTNPPKQIVVAKDKDLEPENIKKDVTIEGITGTAEVIDKNSEFQLWMKEARWSTATRPMYYFDTGNITRVGLIKDDNLIPANIKKDIKIENITGTYDGESGGKTITVIENGFLTMPMNGGNYYTYSCADTFTKLASATSKRLIHFYNLNMEEILNHTYVVGNGGGTVITITSKDAGAYSIEINDGLSADFTLFAGSFFGNNLLTPFQITEKVFADIEPQILDLYFNEDQSAIMPTSTETVTSSRPLLQVSQLKQQITVANFNPAIKSYISNIQMILPTNATELKQGGILGVTIVFADING